MAQTYTIGEALNLCAPAIRRDLEDQQAAYFANIAQNAIWNKYDWRETLAPLPPFYLTPGEQDYGAPATIIPSDFLGLREGYLVNTSSAERITLKVRRDIRTTRAQSLPSLISYEPTLKRFRFFPRLPFGIGGTDWLIDGTYKMRPAKITAGALQTTLIPWDDLYLQVFVGALKWAAFDASGDQRAGTAQVQGGQVIYTGQLGIMHDAIDMMAQQEGLNLGDPSIAPSEPLVSGGSSGFFLSDLGGF